MFTMENYLLSNAIGFLCHTQTHKANYRQCQSFALPTELSIVLAGWCSGDRCTP